MTLGTACGAYLMFVAVVLAGIWQPAGQQQPPRTGDAVPTGPAQQGSAPHGGTDLSETGRDAAARHGADRAEGTRRDTGAGAERRGSGSRPPSRLPAPAASAHPATRG
ncbi:hypothetical protein ACQEU8_01445 [Streptomyces sp. CA-250714]|uniref:hypothetical protein n=1 Tax=Streptomyces sp. CA-250714 TaxID=3240060 RepID=UPI003D8ED781